MTSMPNKAFVNEDGFSEIVLEGSQTADLTFEVIQKSIGFSNQLSSEGKEIKVLIEATKMIDHDLGAVQKTTGTSTALAFDKLAIYGVAGENRTKMVQIIIFGGKKKKGNLIDNIEEDDER